MAIAVQTHYFLGSILINKIWDIPYHPSSTSKRRTDSLHQYGQEVDFKTQINLDAESAAYLASID